MALLPLLHKAVVLLQVESEHLLAIFRCFMFCWIVCLTVLFHKQHVRMEVRKIPVLASLHQTTTETLVDAAYYLLLQNNQSRGSLLFLLTKDSCINEVKTNYLPVLYTVPRDKRRIKKYGLPHNVNLTRLLFTNHQQSATAKLHYSNFLLRQILLMKCKTKILNCLAWKYVNIDPCKTNPY